MQIQSKALGIVYGADSVEGRVVLATVLAEDGRLDKLLRILHECRDEVDRAFPPQSPEIANRNRETARTVFLRSLAYYPEFRGIIPLVTMNDTVNYS